MSLILCPECGRQISDKADACPNCGFPVQKLYNHANGSPQPSGVQPANIQQPILAQPQYTAQGNGTSTQQTYTEHTDAPTPKKKKSHWTLVVAFGIALTICGVGYYYYNDARNQQEMADYTFAMQSDDQLVMESYLLRYQDAPSEHRDSVTQRIASLKQLDNDWTNAQASGSRNQLQDYVKTHPDSPHKGTALNMIDSIDYAIAKRQYQTSNGSLSAIKKYLQDHPDGRYAGDAQSIVEDYEATNVSPEEEATARTVCRKFFQAINSKNESKLLETVATTLSSFLNRSSASSSDVITFMNKLYKDDITNMNWHILDDFKAEKVKGENGKYNMQVQFGAEQKIERTDASKEKYGRYIISAEISPEGLISKFNMKKVAGNKGN